MPYGPRQRTNGKEAADQAISEHVDRTKNFDKSDEERIIDLLTDLRHWCAANDVAFDNAVRISKNHFNDEN